MAFYFCGRYINIDADEREVKHDMFTTVPHFWGSSDRYGYEWKNHLEDFFSYFSLTSEQKYQHGQLRLVGEAYRWLEDSHIDYRC